MAKITKPEEASTTTQKSLRERLAIFTPTDVPTTVACIEKSFRTPIHMFFPGQGRQIVYHEDGPLGPRAEGKGQENWVICYDRLWMLLNQVGCLPYASYAMEVTMDEWLLSIVDILECTEKSIGAAYGDSYNYESSFDEMSERILAMLQVAVSDRMPLGDYSAPFLKASFRDFHDACDQIIEKYPVKSMPDLKRQSAYLHRKAESLPCVSDRMNEEIEVLREKFTGPSDWETATLKSILTSANRIAREHWEPWLELQHFIDSQHALWLWLYDDVLMPLMQAAAAFYYYRNKADRHPLTGDFDGKRIRNCV